MLVINAPFFFAAIWKTIEGFLDERTRSKVEIVGTNFKERILQEIDEDQLADYLGGSNKNRLQDTKGVWDEYELVDSAEPGATVGVRKISTGELFTTNDLMQLPNPNTGS